MSVGFISPGYNFDHQFFEEFLAEFNDTQSEIENLLIALENTPSDNNLLNNLFRKVHNIKGNSHFLGLQVMTDFIHSLETLLEKLRNGDLVYNRQLGDVILNAVDQIGSLVHTTRISNKTFGVLDSFIQNDLQNIGCNVDPNAQRQKDLIFFAEIIEKAEQRSPLWKGRMERILRIICCVDSSKAK